MSTIKRKKTGDDQGFVLVLALLALLVLTLIAVGGLTSSSFESTISGNDLRAKKTFFKADGGTELGAQLLEVSFACGSVVTGHVADNIKVYSPFLYHNETVPSEPYPSETARDICLPSGDLASPTLSDCAVGSGKEQTNLVMYGKEERVSGAGMQMIAGYEGVGKSDADGSVAYRHQILAQNILPDNSTAVLQVQWLHVVGKGDSGLCR